VSKKLFIYFFLRALFFVLAVFCHLFTTKKRGSTAVIHASHGGHSDIVKLLLEAGADMELRRHDVSSVCRTFVGLCMLHI